MIEIVLELYKEHEAKVSDKWSLYLTEYRIPFHSYRTHPVRLARDRHTEVVGPLELLEQINFAEPSTLIGCDIKSGLYQLQL